MPFEHRFRWDRGDLGAEPARELEGRGQSLAFFLAKAGGARGFDMQRDPRRAQRIGQPLGRADQPVSARQFAHRHQQPVAPGPGAGEAQSADIVEHLRVDRLRGAAQRQFAQSGEVRLGEEVAERPRRLVRDVDLALLQPLDQLVGRDVDDLDLGILETPSGTVSRTRTLVKEATTSLRLSMCWMLIVVKTSIPAASSSSTSW